MKRRSKRDTQTTRSRLGRRELALYDGTHLLGTIKVAADGRSVASQRRWQEARLVSDVRSGNRRVPQICSVSGGI